MDLHSYYRRRAGSARRLAGVSHGQPQTKAALERVAREYDGIVQDLEKYCGRDPATRYDVAAYIESWRTRRAFAAVDASPFDQPIKVSRHAVRVKVDHGRRTDFETGRQNSPQVEDGLTR